MEKQQSSDKLYFIKVTSDEETKKKKKININYNNIHKSYQKNTQKTFFKKKTNIENNNLEKYKSKKSSGQINEDSSPTKETMNSPSHNNNNFNFSQNDKDKEKTKEYIKQDIKETIKKKEFSNEKYNDENNNKDNKSKNKEFDTIESIKKIENEDELVTSFERKPSELKSPHTISEDSFTSSIYEEEKSKANKNDYQKNEGRNNNLIKRDSHTYSELVDNELIYVDKINNNKDDDEENDIDFIDKKEKDINKNEIEIENGNKKIHVSNLKIPEVDIKEKMLNEKELKERERDKKKEKFKNIEIKTKMTTRQTTFINNSDNKHNTNGNINSNKITVNKSPREFIMKTERECPSSNFNNIINMSNKNMDEKIPYIPVNQRKKLTVNKKIIDQNNTKDTNKTNSLNYLDSDIPVIEILKKNDKEKLFLSSNKNNEKKVFGVIKTNNTEEKNRYRKKYYMYGNYSKDNDYNTNNNKINKENVRYNNKGSISNRKQKDLKNNFENKIFKSLSHTIEVSNDYNNNSKRTNRKDNEESIDKRSNNIEKTKKDEINEFYPKKNSVLITKKNNNSNSNKCGLSIDDSYFNRHRYIKQPSTNNIGKKISFYSNSNKLIYEPKKLGVIRVRSTEKAGIPPLYSNMSYDPNQYLNTKIKDALSSQNNNKNNVNNLNSSVNNKINKEDNLLKKNSENIQKSMIELSNSFTPIDPNNHSYNLGLLNNTMVNNLNNINNINNLNNLNSILNSSYDIGKIENFRNNNNIYLSNIINNKINNNALLLNKMTEKANSVSSFTNLLNQNERYSLNNYYDKETQNNNGGNNNLVLSNMQQNLLFHNNSSYDIGLNEQMKNLRNQTQLINLIGNNFLGPNIVQNNPSNNLNNSLTDLNNINLQSLLQNNFNNNTNLENNNSNSFSINFEDLIILQEYLREIIVSLNKNKVIENECFEFWNYYYNSSICCQLEKLFINPLDSNAVRISINYTLMSIMLCYDYSFETDLLNKAYNTLNDILRLNYKNLILICEHILSKITKESLTNIWVLKLSTIVNASNFNDYNQFLMNEYNMTIVEKISYNTNIIVQNLRFLLKNFKSNKNDILTSMFKKIREKTYEEINTFFRENILRITNLNGSILASVFLLRNNNFRTLPSPYVRTKNNKEFSLVLDLDETLIHFKPRDNGEEGGILRVRPGINEFLDKVGKYYELIIFTTATQDYADVLIDAVEDDKIYFDHRLYREHAIIIDNDFVKDLKRIGRPLDKIIIVDNMPQNFRLQKENGIIIKAFWGEDNYDTALYDLIPILVNIAKEGGDVRKSLLKYKDEIVKNVTSCISKVNI